MSRYVSVLVKDRGFESENNTSADVATSLHIVIRITGFLHDVSASNHLYLSNPLFPLQLWYGTYYDTGRTVVVLLLLRHTTTSASYALGTQVDVDN
jgi:hypothetical protein